MELTEQIPGLKAANEQERHVREVSFLTLPENIAGIDVPALTLGHLVALSVIQNSFLTGATIDQVSIAEFILLLRPSRAIRRWLILRKIAAFGYERAAQEIIQFLTESFQDAPGGGKPGISYYCPAVALVDLFAREYGWCEADVLEMPVKRIFQYRKAIVHHYDPKAILFNPSDRVRGEWLRKTNEAN